MRSSFILVAVVAAAVAASRCGGGGDSSPPTPTTPAPTTVTVSIVGTKGNQSYLPNPVPKASGDLVIFKNKDTVTHHIVMDDGSTDFGVLSPGASSQPKAIFGNQSRGASNLAMAVGDGNFYCANHPSMVGSINGAQAPTPPPGSGDGY